MRRVVLAMLIATALMSSLASATDSDNDGVDDSEDAFPDSSLWSDSDGDGYADQTGHDGSDDCPFTYGKSRYPLKGCSDIDNDFIPDLYDDDADGDGIRNEMERAASTGLVLYDPFNANSVPLDSDQDTIPDVIDDDNDDDGWPDDIELDRGSDPFDEDETPFSMYMGISTGFFYEGGFTTSSGYDGGAIEISLSGLLDIITEELVIPLLLVPLYLYIHRSRKRTFEDLEKNIMHEKDQDELFEFEIKVNDMVKARRLKVWHGLVLRNSIEQRENELRAMNVHLDVSTDWTRSCEEE